MPAGLDPVLTVATYLTLAWEISFAFLVWHRWTRPIALVSGILVHLGIFMGMEVGSFSWVTVATYVAFVDPQTLAGLVDRHSAVTPPDARSVAVAHDKQAS